MNRRASGIALFLSAALLAVPASSQLVKMPEKTSDFLGYCKTNAITCVNFIQSVGKVLIERGEKSKKPEICIPKDSGDRNDYDRIMRWIMLRPETHTKPTNAVLAEALKGIYPCAAATPAKAEKSAVSPEKSEKK
jgi:hypothetical protein